MRRNALREKLKAGETTVGTRVHGVWPAEVEVLGHTGLYDYVEFVAEYGSFDLHDLENLCRAAELHGMDSMIKIDQSHQRFLAQRGIGAGFSSVLFTDCRSADDVRECVRVVRPDTPGDNGLYGIAARRNAYMDRGGSPAYVQSLRDIVVAIMIEKKSAVDELEEILSVHGVDMVQWGGSDFSMSIGRPGERKHPEVDAARKKVFETAIRMGVPPRAEIFTPDEAREYLDMGVRHFSIGTDLFILQDWWTDNGNRLKEIIDGR